MTGRNGWDSARHDTAAINPHTGQPSDTPLTGDDGKLSLRLEYEKTQTAIIYTDKTAPRYRRCVSVRTDRRTGMVFVGTGPTQREAGVRSLAALDAWKAKNRSAETTARWDNPANTPDTAHDLADSVPQYRADR